MSAEQKEELYEKILTDLGKTNTAFHQWWNEKSKKYNWKSAKNGNWQIDFETNEILLVKNDTNKE